MRHNIMNAVAIMAIGGLGFGLVGCPEAASAHAGSCLAETTSGALPTLRAAHPWPCGPRRHKPVSSPNPASEVRAPPPALGDDGTPPPAVDAHVPPCCKK